MNLTREYTTVALKASSRVAGDIMWDKITAMFESVSPGKQRAILNRLGKISSTGGLGILDDLGIDYDENLSSMLDSPFGKIISTEQAKNIVRVAHQNWPAAQELLGEIIPLENFPEYNKQQIDPQDLEHLYYFLENILTIIPAKEQPLNETQTALIDAYIKGSKRQLNPREWKYWDEVAAGRHKDFPYNQLYS